MFLKLKIVPKVKPLFISFLFAFFGILVGQKLLSYENNLRENLKNSETVLLSHSIWNDKILVRMVAKDAYDLKSIQKNLISILADDNIPKVWNS